MTKKGFYKTSYTLHLTQLEHDTTKAETVLKNRVTKERCCYEHTVVPGNYSVKETVKIP